MPQDFDDFMSQQQAAQAPPGSIPSFDDFMIQKQTAPATPAAAPSFDDFMASKNEPALPAFSPAPAPSQPAAPATAPKKTLWQKVKETLFNPEPSGLAVESGQMTPEEAKARGYSGLSEPLIPLSQITAPYMAPNPEDRPPTPVMSTGSMFARPIQRTAGPEEQQPTELHGVLRAAEGMTSPIGLGMIAAIGPLTSPDLEFLGFLNSTLLAGDTGYKAIKAYQMANALDAKGLPIEATVARTEAITNAAMGLGFIYHGVKGAAGAGNAYTGAVDNIRAGLNSPHLDGESLDYIRSVVEKADIEPADKAYLLAVADARATQMAKQGPLVAGIPPQTEAPAPGTMATGPFPGPQPNLAPTVREQLQAPSQALLPTTETAGPTQPLPGLNMPQQRPSLLEQIESGPEPPAAPPPTWEQTITQPKPAAESRLPIYSRPPATEPLPGLNMPPAAIDPDAPMLNSQRRAIFGIADSKGIPAEGVEQLAGKPISQLTVAEAREAIARLNSLTAEGAQALKPRATMPLIDQVMASQAGPPEALAGAFPRPTLTDQVEAAYPAGPGQAIGQPTRPTLAQQMEAAENTTTFGAPRKPPQYDPDVSLVNAIRYLGGIDPDKIRGSGLWTEWTERVPQGIRLALQRKGAAHGLDTVGAELAHLGYQGYDTADSVVEALHDPRIAKAGMREISEAPELEQAYAHIGELERRLRETEFNPEDLTMAGEEPGRVIREPGEEGSARFRDEKTRSLFEDAPFLLRSESGAEREELPRAIPKTGELRPGPQQVPLLQGPLFEPRERPSLLEQIEAEPEPGNRLLKAMEAERAAQVASARPGAEPEGGEPNRLLEDMQSANETAPAPKLPVSEATPNRLLEAMRQSEQAPERPRPVSEVADQFAQMEVDRRAAAAREAIERVADGKGTWIEKRRQLDLPTGRGYYGDQFREVPIGRSEIDGAVKREMAETSRLTGLTPIGAQVSSDLPQPKTGSLFGDDEGFLRFRNRPIVDDDPQMKRIFDRLEEAEKNARRSPLDILPRPGEADVPNSGAHRVSWIRSADQALARYEDTAPVAREIKYAAREKKMAMQHYDDIASKIVKEGGIKKGSEEDRMVKDLLDEAYTGLTPEWLRDSPAYRGNKEAAIKAAGRLRDEIFDPIISQIRGDPELTDIIGKRGYIRGYFPHYEQAMKAKYGADYMGMVRALLPERFMSTFLKERAGDQWANDVSIHDVIPAYINSTMKTIHDIPAYNRALAVIKGLPEGPAKKFAQWYTDNYMGQPAAKEGFMVNNAPYQAFSRWVAQRYYDNLIGLNPNTWLKQLGKTMINTYPELGARYTWDGIRGMFDPAQRQQFHDSGLLFDHPGMEAGILKEGMRRSILHGGTAAAQYVDRGIAYLGGLAQAKDMGLVGRAAQMHAMDVTDKVAFAYGKESGIRYIQNLPPDWRVFQTWPAKEFEFVRNMVSDARSGGTPERARLARFLMINLGVPAALTAAGVPTGKVFVDLFHILPRPFRSGQLMIRCYNWLQGVANGKVKPEDIPSDVISGLWDAFGPAANIAKQIFGKRSLHEDMKKSAAR